MNKKGVTFAITIMIASVAILALAFTTAFTSSNQRTDDLISPLGILNVREETREAQFYIDESAKLAAKQAAHKLNLNLTADEKCGTWLDNPAIFDVCVFDSQRKEKFLKDFEFAFVNYLQKYKSTLKVLPNQQGFFPDMYSSVIALNYDNYDYEIVGDKLVGTAKKKLSYEQQNFEYSVDFSFEASLDFEMDSRTFSLIPYLP